MGKEQIEDLAFIGGMDLTPYATGAELIRNMRYDIDDRCWRNDRSWISYLNPDDAAATDVTNGTTSIYSIYSYELHKQAVHHLLYEQEQADGTLTLFCIAGPDRITLKQGRTKPGPNDAGTQYIRMGRYLFIVNGTDDPLLYEGNSRIRRAFFHEPPRPPRTLPAPGLVSQTNGWAGDGDQSITFKAGGAGLNLFCSEHNLGFAPSPANEVFIDSDDGYINFTVPTWNSFEYAVSFVSDTGAESPLSDYSPMLSFNMAGGVQYGASGNNSRQYKFGSSITNIPKGPLGTVKRRLYRTKNQKDGLTGAGRILYFLTELSDNYTTNFFDLCPDSSLGAEAPKATSSGLFPSGVAIGTGFVNHLIVSGSSQNPYTIYYSSGNRPEQFPDFNFIDVGSDGGAITQLYTADNICYVFREHSIDILLPSGNPDVPFMLQPLTQTVGCMAPNTVAMVPGVGVMFLGSDKHVYAITSAGSSSFYQGQGQVVKLSEKIYKDLERISKNAMARAVGICNPHDQEYWVHCPTDGSDTPFRGYVYHAPIQGWSVREGIPANCFTYIPEGFVTFGSNSPLTFTAGGNQNSGIMTWCGAKGSGYGGTGGQTRTQPTGIPSYTFETTWMSLGDPNIIKHLKKVYLHVYRQEAGGGDLEVGVDWKPLEYENLTKSTPSSNNKTSFETKNTEQTPAGLFDTAVLGGAFDAGSVRDIDKNRFSAREITNIGISIPQQAYQPTAANNIASSGAAPVGETTPLPTLSADAMLGAGGNRWFKIRLKGEKTIALIGMTFEYEVNGVVRKLTADAGKVDSNVAGVLLMGL